MTSPVLVTQTRTAAEENFPVGSWVLPAPLRPHIHAFYAFARAADDIADSPDLAAADKIRRLDLMEAALAGDGPDLAVATRMRDSLIATGVSDRHCRDLLAAFRQDAVKLRYADWGELIGYCNLSAAPVGRFLLDLHGERRQDYPPADALCNALQILNHLQDCQRDHRALDRVYLPLDWLGAAGLDVTCLDAPAATPPLRAVLDRALDGVDALLTEARALPGRLRSRRLAAESQAIFLLASRLSRRLRSGDPLAGRVALSRADFALAALRGLGRGLRPTAGRAADNISEDNSISA